MDLVLVSITGISLALAVAMGIVVFKLLREERMRSDARVALLTAAAVSPDASLDLSAIDTVASADEEPVERTGLFYTPETASPWGQRAAIAAGIGSLIVVAALARGSGQPSPPSAESNPVASAPLELLALRHAQDADGLTISGLVLNPRSGVAASQVAATAFLLDANGEVLASGRANLDYPTLAPGDESPFVIKIPVTGTVSRYRVGFRGPDGAVIAHIDRRPDGTAARTDHTGSVAPWVR